MKNNKKILMLLGAAALVVFVGMGLFGSGSGEDGISESVSKEKLTVYKTPSCGCCANYVAYLRREGYEVEMLEVSNSEISNIKNTHGVPGNMSSCHTTVMGDYVIEGHIPVKAIIKLASESPDIKGIAMPGMPSGSPGMPGTKRGSFSIYSIDNSGNTSIFTEL